MNILVTGAAGFIGSAVSRAFTDDETNQVLGVDNINEYYDTQLKMARRETLNKRVNFKFKKIDMSKTIDVLELFSRNDFDLVIHLAAQAGVRYSLDNPLSYADSNLTGHLNILEGCRQAGVKHLVYASSSSVYGLNRKVPFATQDPVDHPISLYAATKKSNELMAHSYSHLYDLPTTGLRFFTVYGPWGRPDMAPYLFTHKILEGDPIDVNNHGDMWRDFTYIDDIVEGIVRISRVIPTKDPFWRVEHGSPAQSSAPYAVYNIGCGQPVNLLDFIKEIEKCLGLKARMKLRAMQPGDVYQTFADTKDLFEATGYKPRVNIEEGIHKMVNWHLDYYGLPRRKISNQ